MNYKRLFINIFIPLIIGGIVALIMIPFNDYKNLNQPILAPPAFIFPVVWSILYVLMGISAYLISKKNSIPFVYYVQLFVNALWSIFFFVFKWRLFAFIWLILLAILIIIMIIKFMKIDKLAAYLQIPYLLWVLFAGYLNISIYLLN